jgi:catechol 2,3-dioxygenase-like lactoylglutathione lyase family enzyme
MSEKSVTIEASAAPVQHIGITVSDLDRSLKFYGDVFGGTPFGREVTTRQAEWAGLGMVETTVDHAFLPVGNTLLELLAYETPVGRPFDLRRIDVGAVHISFGVEDLRGMHARMVDIGVKFVGEPLEVENPAFGRFTYVFFDDPDGFPLELFESVAPAGVVAGAGRATHTGGAVR